MTPIPNERQEIPWCCQEQPDGRVDVRTKNGELVGWTANRQTRAKDCTIDRLRGECEISDGPNANEN
jgi:hypothetical protein